MSECHAHTNIICVYLVNYGLQVPELWTKDNRCCTEGAKDTCLVILLSHAHMTEVDICNLFVKHDNRPMSPDAI